MTVAVVDWKGAKPGFVLVQGDVGDETVVGNVYRFWESSLWNIRQRHNAKKNDLRIRKSVVGRLAFRSPDRESAARGNA